MVNSEVNLAFEEVLSLVHTYLLTVCIGGDGPGTGSSSTTTTTTATNTESSLQAKCHEYEQE